MMKPSTRAAKLQVKIAYWMLSGRKRPKELVPNKEWYSGSKIYHVINFKPIEIHCKTCECGNKVTSLCGRFEYDPKSWRYGYLYKEDFDGKRPCKSCLQSLSKIANGR